MTENEAIDVILKDHSAFKNPMSKAYVMACKALEEIQQYRAIETELKEKYHANVDIKMLMQYFIENIFKGEKHEGFCILTNKDAKMLDEYRAIGTVEEIQRKIDALKYDCTRYEEQLSIARGEKQVFTDDDMLLEEYRAIGTIEELKDLKEKSEPKKPITYAHTHRADCPNCKATVRGIDKPFGDYCSKCGIKLDWSK